MPTHPIRVAVLGSGMSLTVFHRPSLLYHKDKYTLHSVLERSGQGEATRVCGEGVKVVKTLDGITNDPEVDLVVISTPNNTHYPFAKTAIEAGKHVLLEKPMCVTVAHAIELTELAEEKGVILSVYQNRRWDSDFLTVLEVLSSGRLGELVDFTSSYDKYLPLPPTHKLGWKESPGEYNDAIYGLGSHTIDQIYVLFVHDGTLLRTRGHSTTPFVVTVGSRILSSLPHQERFIIRGTLGSYVKYGIDPQEGRLKRIDSSTVLPEGCGTESESSWGHIYECRAPVEGEKSIEGSDGAQFVIHKYKSVPGNYNALYANLYEAISSGDKSKLAVKPEQAIDVLRIIEIGQKAAKEERILRVSET
ncbi:NAD binding Rossmann fold oxidoreductase [Naematelia encephala]|uniref:NAD binding Rossmann fold oxidoreductase n=1 Tax=Naematelia encephala TaxID=71784 RepID=A0A1Y2AHT5_9TREE|nr:NAD binding Rossmann fold oxidoreductase [Naematelia encephala]